MPTKTERSSWTTELESQNTTSVGTQVLESLNAGGEYRHAFVEEKVQTFIAAQIRAIRMQRKMSRPELARKMGKAASWIFRLEDPNEPPPTVSTLLEVARCYDVDLKIEFSPFSKVRGLIDSLEPDSLEVPSFEEERAESARIVDQERDAKNVLRFRVFDSSAPDRHGYKSSPPIDDSDGEPAKKPPSIETADLDHSEEVRTAYA